MEAYDLYSQFNPDISNESSEDSYAEGNLLSIKGFIMSENIGSTYVYDRFFRKTYGSEVEWEDFNEVINYVPTIGENTFRNLVLTINAEGQVFRRISLTKKRLLAISDNIYEGFRSCTLSVTCKWVL